MALTCRRGRGRSFHVKGRETQRETETERETDRQTDTETETDTDRHRQRERERGRGRENNLALTPCKSNLARIKYRTKQVRTCSWPGYFRLQIARLRFRL